MKILIPILGFGNSGGNRVLSKLADELILLGNDVTFLCPDCSDLPYFPTNANIIWAGKSGKINGLKSYKKKKVNFLGVQFKLWITLLRLRPKAYDVYIANHSLTTYPLKFSALAGKTLYYVQAYEPDYFELLPGIKNKVFKLLSEFSYKMNFFTVVNAEKYQLYKKLNSKRVLYPGVDFSIFHPISETKKGEEIILGTVGRKEHFKGTPTIIEAFNQLKKKYSNIKLIVAFGDPADFADYNDVFCIRPENDIQLALFYQSLDYYICAMYSQLDTFHYPVVEAMSCGVSLITTSFYPANPENAWIIKPQNAENLIVKFEEAQNELKKKKEKISQALKDVKQFHWKNVGEKMNSYLNEFLMTTRKKLK